MSTDVFQLAVEYSESDTTDCRYGNGTIGAFMAGFAAALSEHEQQVGWWYPSREKFARFRPDDDYTPWTTLGWEPVFVRRSVEVQSSEVPRTPEEPT